MNSVILISGGYDSISICEERRQNGHLKNDLLIQFIYPHPSMPMEREAVSKYRTKLALQGVDPAFREIHLPIDGWTPMGIGTGQPGPREVPLRNATMLMVAAQIAASEGFESVIIGAVKDDWNDYPDCHPDFFDKLNDITQIWDVSILAPLLNVNKTSIKLNPEIKSIAWSCYQPTGNREPCGSCNSCEARPL